MPDAPGATSTPPPVVSDSTSFASRRSRSGYVLAAFVSWALLLLVVMGTIRTYPVVTGKVAANVFAPDNSGLSPLMQRLARAQANCIEGLPVFGGCCGGCATHRNRNQMAGCAGSPLETYHLRSR
ncbi:MULTISPECIES: MAPEG family protein [unclassified Bradyrhizobium]|uniref:MAPEG family protein n=1 Tax=unclassified Bradyrhizobium TaxID=2631580 RepID=UPI002112FF9F|nr:MULTISPECIES: MAPEG family protein [unclassified Bradyrhizobium]